ncbi:MAG TPA: hypothetical protein VEQ59_12820 [Polyangiaceae bacterium]|nr:hypothetical protein [Polyangiaceae bacterium]
MSDDSERSYLPWVMATLVLVIGGAKLDAARPIVARFMAVAIPIVPVVLGVKRVEGGALLVERVATAVGWLTVLAAELCVLSGFFHYAPLRDAAGPARMALYVALAGALVAHTLEAKSHGKARFAGYVGIAAGFGLFISTHGDKDPFAAVFGAFFIAVLAGGAALLVGEVLARVLGRAP